MSQETNKILKMLEEGKISFKEAESLLSALGETRGRHMDFGIDHSQLRDEMDCLRENIHQINPGRIVAEAMAGVKDGLKGLKDIHAEIDVLRGSEKALEKKVITVPAQGVTALSVSQPRSDFEITGTDGDQIVIRADIQVWAEEQDEAREKLKSLDITTENESGTLRIKVDGPPWTKKRRAKVDFTIEMPRSIMPEISTASGGISVSGLQNGARLETASGDISVADSQGPIGLSSASGDIGAARCRKAELTARTASGDIEFADCAGQASFQTVSGDVAIGLDGQVQGQTVSGDIEVVSLESGGFKIRSTSGDVRFQGRLGGAGDWLVATVSGDVDLELADGSAARLEAGSVSGEIDCELELTELRQTNRRLSGRLGQGQGLLEIKTVSGDINIH